MTENEGARIILQQIPGLNFSIFSILSQSKDFGSLGVKCSSQNSAWFDSYLIEIYRLVQKLWLKMFPRQKVGKRWFRIKTTQDHTTTIWGNREKLWSLLNGVLTGKLLRALVDPEERLPAEGTERWTSNSAMDYNRLMVVDFGSFDSTFIFRKEFQDSSPWKRPWQTLKLLSLMKRAKVTESIRSFRSPPDPHQNPIV